MKTLFTFLLVGLFSPTLFGQLNFQEDLFSPDTVMKYRAKIQLTEDQTKEIEDIADTHYNAFRKLKWDLDEAQQQLNDQLASSQVDQDQALAKMDRVTALENQLKKMRLQMLIGVKNSLNEDQQNILRKLRTKEDQKNVNITTSINEAQKIKLEVGKNFQGKDQPLYIISRKNNQMEVNQLDMKSLDPNNIESVTVLKGKSAISKYGNKGKNGVIEIVLKDK